MLTVRGGQVDKRKRANKEELEHRKRQTETEEKERESKRLNFLLTQTQLYSHFMAKKLGMEDENSQDDLALEQPDAMLDDSGCPLLSPLASSLLPGHVKQAIPHN